MAFALSTIFDCIKRDSPFATTPNERFAHLIFRIEKVFLKSSFTRATIWRQAALRWEKVTIATTRRDDGDEGDESDESKKWNIILNLFHEN